MKINAGTARVTCYAESRSVSDASLLLLIAFCIIIFPENHALYVKLDPAPISRTMPVTTEDTVLPIW